MKLVGDGLDTGYKQAKGGCVCTYVCVCVCVGQVE